MGVGIPGGMTEPEEPRVNPDPPQPPGTPEVPDLDVDVTEFISEEDQPESPGPGTEPS
ncbi:hypothetical protein LV78_003730 [Actinosynnema pretiosum]|nr:hypothetical protein [Actinosynnema pretiosum]